MNKVRKVGLCVSARTTGGYGDQGWAIGIWYLVPIDVLGSLLGWARNGVVEWYGGVKVDGRS